MKTQLIITKFLIFEYFNISKNSNLYLHYKLYLKSISN